MPVGSKRLVAEDGSKTVGAQLSSGPISEELEDESDFGERSEHSGNMELDLFVILLILQEPVVFELLEHFVVHD